MKTCPVCFEDISCKQLHITSCRHSFHRECIHSWYERSDDCPICRTEQDQDPIIVFKRNIKAIMEETYMDAIRSLENDNERLRRRRARR